MNKFRFDNGKVGVDDSGGSLWFLCIMSVKKLKRSQASEGSCRCSDDTSSNVQQRRGCSNRRAPAKAAGSPLQAVMMKYIKLQRGFDVDAKAG